jgi:hypothetical protein
MSKASTETYKDLPKDEKGNVIGGHITKGLIMSVLKEFGPHTVHDLFDRLKRMGIVPVDATYTGNQWWSETVSRIGDLVYDDGVLDTTEVPSPKKATSLRSLYSIRPGPPQPRLRPKDKKNRALLRAQGQALALKEENEALRLMLIRAGIQPPEKTPIQLHTEALLDGFLRDIVERWFVPPGATVSSSYSLHEMGIDKKGISELLDVFLADAKLPADTLSKSETEGLLDHHLTYGDFKKKLFELLRGTCLH